MSQRRWKLSKRSVRLWTDFLRVPSSQLYTSGVILGLLSFIHHGGRHFQSPGWSQARNYHRWGVFCGRFFGGHLFCRFATCVRFFFFFFCIVRSCPCEKRHTVREMTKKVVLPECFCDFRTYFNWPNVCSPGIWYCLFHLYYSAVAVNAT